MNEISNKNRSQAVSEDELALARTLGRNVRTLRASQAMPKYVLANMAGISRPYLNNIERGTANVRLTTVQHLADALSVSPFDLLSERIPL